MEAINETTISGEVVKTYPIKKTLNGLEIVTFVLEHISNQLEAGLYRTVKCRVFCIIVNVTEFQLKQLDSGFISVTGFLSQNSKAQIVLNVKQIIDKGSQ